MTRELKLRKGAKAAPATEPSELPGLDALLDVVGQVKVRVVELVTTHGDLRADDAEQRREEERDGAERERQTAENVFISHGRLF